MYDCVYMCVCVFVSMLCTSVRRLLAVGQNLPRLRLLIITIKHNDYSFSSFHFASESGRERERERVRCQMQHEEARGNAL